MKIMVPEKQMWLRSLRRYLLFIFLSNLVWETLHLPLYTLWIEGSFEERLFAVIHCTGGDILIALACIITALILLGDKAWPARHFYRVAVLTIALGLTYTIFSEWLNVMVRKSWAYSELMPILSPFATGLSPVLQWLVIPAFGFWWARRTNLSSPP